MVSSYELWFNAAYGKHRRSYGRWELGHGNKYHVPPAKRRALVEEAVRAVGLEEKLRTEAGKLSGGQKQRVAIARALVVDPNIIFADEPTGNLDSRSGLQIMDILKSLNEKGRTVVLVTHETQTAEFADRIIRVKDGLIESDEAVTKRSWNGTLK